MIDDCNKKPRKESGLCCFSFARNSHKWVTQIYFGFINWVDNVNWPP